MKKTILLLAAVIMQAATPTIAQTKQAAKCGNKTATTCCKTAAAKTCTNNATLCCKTDGAKIMAMLHASGKDNYISKAEAADGWRLLWDGKTTDGWRGAKLDKFPQKGWTIENGVLKVMAGNGGEAANGGDIMKMYLKIKDGKIEDVKFETFGCGSAIASSSMATEMIKGKSIEDALALTNKEVVDALGGLPAHKLHCSVLAEEAVKSAVKDYYDKNGIAYAVGVRDLAHIPGVHEVIHHSIGIQSHNQRSFTLQNEFPFAGFQILPHGGHAPQVLHDAGYLFQNVVHLLLRGVVAQAQPQGAVGDLVGAADGQQHMAFISGATAGTYAGIAAMMSIPLTMKQASILALMMSVLLSG